MFTIQTLTTAGGIPETVSVPTRKLLVMQKKPAYDMSQNTFSKHLSTYKLKLDITELKYYCINIIILCNH